MIKAMKDRIDELESRLEKLDADAQNRLLSGFESTINRYDNYINLDKTAVKKIEENLERGGFFSIVKQVVDYVEVNWPLIRVILFQSGYGIAKEIFSKTKLKTAIDIVAKYASDMLKKLGENTVIDMIENYLTFTKESVSLNSEHGTTNIEAKKIKKFKFFKR